MRLGTRGKGPLAQWQTWAVIGLIGVVAYIIMFNPFQQGGAGVNLGYVLSDGTEVIITSGTAQMTFFMDPQTLAWYTNDSRTQRVVGLWGELNVNPILTDMTDPDVSITWNREVSYSFLSPYTVWNVIPPGTGSGTTTVPPNVYTVVTASKYTKTLELLGLTQGTTHWFKWAYNNVQASALDPNVGSKTATANVYGTISVYWAPDGTLTLNAFVGSGRLFP